MILITGIMLIYLYIERILMIIIFYLIRMKDLIYIVVNLFDQQKLTEYNVG
jgi:hypothetical protein